jgi:hypothetical protein
MIYVITVLIFTNLITLVCSLILKDDLVTECSYTRQLRREIDSLDELRRRLEDENSRMKKDIKEIRQISIR